MELRKSIAAALKWWRLALLLMLVAGGASYLVSRMLPSIYQANTVIIVGQTMRVADLNSGDILTSERLARTYADIAQRPPVLQAVIETLDLDDSWEDLEKRVWVQPVRDTELLEITVEASSRDEAQAIADELARQLILLSPTALQGREEREKQELVRQQLENLKARIHAGQEKLAALEAEMAVSGSIERLRELQEESYSLQRLLTDWEANYTQLLSLSEDRRAPNYLAIIQPAQAKPDPVRPRVLLNTFMACVAGLVLALGVIYLLEYLDDTLKVMDDLRHTLKLTPLGAISQFPGNGSQPGLIASQDSFSDASEAYRVIRSNIQFAAVDRAAKTILVTSSGPGEGKSTTTANLGVVMAQTGLKTLILDADLRRSVQHKIFRSVNLAGLTDLLTSPELTIEGYSKVTNVENLWLLTSGFLPPNPSELLNSQRMKQVLSSVQDMFDVVILDSPPVIAFADALVLSNRVDGVVLVAEAGRTRCDVAKQSVSTLQQAGATLLGAVLNRVPPRSGAYYYSRYYQPRQPTELGDQPAGRKKVRRWLPFFKPFH